MQSEGKQGGSIDAVPDGIEERLRALAASEAPDAAAPGDGALWSAVRASTVAAPRTWRTRLQDLPTRLRVVVALSSALTVAAVMTLILGMRSDAGTIAIVRYLIAMGGLALIALACFSVSLRGAHQRPLGPGRWAVVGLALGVPVALALVPGIWTGKGQDSLQVGFSCMLLGGITGALVSVPVFMLQRASVPVFARVAAALAGGGVVAFAMLELHCPSSDVSHLLFTHAAVGLVLVAISVVVVWARRR